MAQLIEQSKLLARELQDTSEFKQLDETLAKIKSDPESKQLFDDFQNAQREIADFQQKRSKPTPDKMNNWQEIAKKAQTLPLIKELSERERSLNQLLDQVNSIITAPLTQLYKK